MKLEYSRGPLQSPGEHRLAERLLSLELIVGKYPGACVFFFRNSTWILKVAAIRLRRSWYALKSLGTKGEEDSSIGESSRDDDICCTDDWFDSCTTSLSLKIPVGPKGTDSEVTGATIGIGDLAPVWFRTLGTKEHPRDLISGKM